MAAHRRQSRELNPARSRGAALVEFAFILPALLLLLYGLVVYSVVFVTQQAVAYGAERGAEAVVAVDPELGAAAYQAQALGVARTEVLDAIGYLPGLGGDMVTLDMATPAGSTLGQEVRVTVTYPFSSWNLPAPAFLPLPETLTGVGVTRVRT